MHQINAFLLTIVLIIFTACEDKKIDDISIPIENTTEIFTSKDKLLQAKQIQEQKKKTEARAKIQANKKNITLTDTFKLQDIKDKTFTVSVLNKKVTFKENIKPIVLITFFTTSCPPCIAEIPYINDLHKKYKKDVLFTGILIHDEIKTSDFQSFLEQEKIKYFVSNGTNNNDFANLLAKTLHLEKNFSIPLTAIYVEGHYYTHYEGCVPIEMIEYDLKQARATLK